MGTGNDVSGTELSTRFALQTARLGNEVGIIWQVTRSSIAPLVYDHVVGISTHRLVESLRVLQVLHGDLHHHRAVAVQVGSHVDWVGFLCTSSTFSVRGGVLATGTNRSATSHTLHDSEKHFSSRRACATTSELHRAVSRERQQWTVEAF